jgi:hypothetical protein
MAARGLVLGHIITAVLLQFCIALLLRSWAAGTATAVGWTVSREIAQAEYRWIEQFGDGLRANMPWWGGLDYRVWQRLDSWLDWAIPCAATLAIAAFVSRRRGAPNSDKNAGGGVPSRIMRLLRRLSSAKSHPRLS